MAEGGSVLWHPLSEFVVISYSLSACLMFYAAFYRFNFKLQPFNPS